MLTKLLALVLAGVLTNLIGTASAWAATYTDKDAQFIEKVRTGIAKLGTGPDARVEIKLRDGTKLKGYIRETSAEGFVVIDSKSEREQIVTYPQVKKVNGNNLSKGAKIAITVGVIFGVLLIGSLTGAISQR